MEPARRRPLLDQDGPRRRYPSRRAPRARAPCASGSRSPATRTPRPPAAPAPRDLPIRARDEAVHVQLERAQTRTIPRRRSGRAEAARRSAPRARGPCEAPAPRALRTAAAGPTRSSPAIASQSTSRTIAWACVAKSQRAAGLAERERQARALGERPDAPGGRRRQVVRLAHQPERFARVAVEPVEPAVQRHALRAGGGRPAELDRLPGMDPPRRERAVAAGLVSRPQRRARAKRLAERFARPATRPACGSACSGRRPSETGPALRETAAAKRRRSRAAARRERRSRRRQRPRPPARSAAPGRNRRTASAPGRARATLLG